MKRTTIAALIMGLLAGISGASAPLAAQVRDHEEGFFLRLSAGAGSAATEATSDAGTTTRYSGTAGDMNFAIGGIVASNLALHGTLFGWAVTSPDIEVGSLSGTASGNLTLAGFGAGVTYYFMPVNIYLSGSLGLGSLQYESGDVRAESKTGVLFDATVGKEWWVGDNWGIGVAVGLTLHSIPDDDIEDNWSGGSVAVRFTATMN